MDVESLLAAISPDTPCGEDLEYGAVADLNRASQLKLEQQIGNTFVPAEEPDWEDVRRTALKLFDETKDLRVAVILAKAAVRTWGWPGFRDVVVLIDGLLERYWLDVHPHLDEDEPDDFTMRVNLIASLGDAETTLTYLREAPLIESVMGRFSLRDIQVADGELSHPADSERPAPERNVIDAAVMAADLDGLKEIADAVNQSAQALNGLEARLMSLVGPVAAPDLSSLSAVLKHAQKKISEGMALRPDAGDASLFDEAVNNEDGGEAGTGETVPAARADSGRADPINGPDDVKRVLEEVCAYYRKCEPSSPIPILLERAARLISKDFLEIIQDIAPDGLPAIEILRGVQEEYGE